MKVLPTQPDHPAIPEEEGDDEDAHERVVGDDAGVEVSHRLQAEIKLRRESSGDVERGVADTSSTRP